MSRLLDLGHQVGGRLPWRRGGTGNRHGWGTALVAPHQNWDQSATLPIGTVVRLKGTTQVAPTTITDDPAVHGVVVGYFRATDGALIEDDCPANGSAAVMVRGRCRALVAANVTDGDYAYAHATDGYAYGSATLGTGAFGRFLASTDLAWSPDLVPVMVGLSASGGGGGGSASPLTTKGDLWGFTTADARVPVGANGRVLTADSSVGPGVDWKVPTSGTMTTKGDLVTRSASAEVRLGVGADGQVLTPRSGATAGLAWEDQESEIEAEFVSPSGGQQTRAIRIPMDCTIAGYTIVANASGNLVVDVWVDTFANFPPTVADTITAAAKPTLSGARTITSVTLTGWTTSLSKGDWLVFGCDSVATIGQFVIALHLRRR